MNIDESWNYLSPAKIVFGVNSFDRLKRYLLDLNIKQNILLVTGRGAMKQHGYVDRLERMAYDKTIYHFDQASPNPTLEDIEQGIRFVNNTNIELVIALGGGSAMDVGKILAILLKNPGSIKDYLEGRKNITCKSLPVIAIPSTSGTASEVTSWSTIWDMQNKKKYSLGHRWMFPEYAIIDPLLTIHMPPYLTACTGMDALTHAIESFWSKSSQPISEVFALRAIRLIRQNLKQAYDQPENETARNNMSLACLFAGLAFNNTKTAACHALSYPMTFNFQIPHGLAVSITLKEVLKFNNREIPDKIRQILEEFGASSVDHFVQLFPEFMQSIGLPVRLRDLGLKENDVELLLSQSIHPDRLNNNSAALTKDEIRTILTNIY